MESPFEKYSGELAARDLRPQSRERYPTILAKYRDWLGSNALCPELGRAFIAELRDKGYAHRSIGLYASALNGFHAFLGEQLGYKHRKRKTLPPYFAWEDAESLLALRDCPLTGIAERVRERDFAVTTRMARAGLRRSEVTKLRVGDVSFSAGHLIVRDGKGGKNRQIPLHDALAAALRPFCEATCCPRARA